jgi:hypothetical protein
LSNNKLNNKKTRKIPKGRSSQGEERGVNISTVEKLFSSRTHKGHNIVEI